MWNNKFIYSFRCRAPHASCPSKSAFSASLSGAVVADAEANALKSVASLMIVCCCCGCCADWPIPSCCCWECFRRAACCRSTAASMRARTAGAASSRALKDCKKERSKFFTKFICCFSNTSKSWVSYSDLLVLCTDGVQSA